MNELTKLLERLRDAESAYVSAKTSLDNSLEYILCKEDLKIARFEWLAACESYILEEVLINEQQTTETV